jgi:hypothetical protein
MRIERTCDEEELVKYLEGTFTVSEIDRDAFKYLSKYNVFVALCALDVNPTRLLNCRVEDLDAIFQGIDEVPIHFRFTEEERQLISTAIAERSLPFPLTTLVAEPECDEEVVEQARLIEMLNRDRMVVIETKLKEEDTEFVEWAIREGYANESDAEEIRCRRLRETFEDLASDIAAEQFEYDMDSPDSDDDWPFINYLDS